MNFKPAPKNMPIRDREWVARVLPLLPEAICTFTIPVDAYIAVMSTDYKAAPDIRKTLWPVLTPGDGWCSEVLGLLAAGSAVDIEPRLRPTTKALEDMRRVAKKPDLTPAQFWVLLACNLAKTRKLGQDLLGQLGYRRKGAPDDAYERLAFASQTILEWERANNAKIEAWALSTPFVA